MSSFRRKDPDGAHWHLDRVLENEPRDTEALRMRAVLHGEAGRWEAALRDWNAALEAGAAVHYERANAHAQLGHWQEAKADFEKAAAGPFEARSLTALALLYLRDGNEAEWRRACMRFGAARAVSAASLLTDGCYRGVTAAPGAPIDWPEIDGRQRARLQSGPWAALLFRRGGHDAEALENLTMDVAMRLPGDLNSAAAGFLRALLEHRLEHPAEARTWLARGREELGRKESWLRDRPLLAGQVESWQERIYAELLEREAAKAIEGR